MFYLFHGSHPHRERKPSSAVGKPKTIHRPFQVQLGESQDTYVWWNAMKHPLLKHQDFFFFQNRFKPGKCIWNCPFLTILWQEISQKTLGTYQRCHISLNASTIRPLECRILWIIIYLICILSCTEENFKYTFMPLACIKARGNHAVPKRKPGWGVPKLMETVLVGNAWVTAMTEPFSELTMMNTIVLNMTSRISPG